MNALHPTVEAYLKRSREIVDASDVIVNALSSGAPDDERQREIDYTVDQLIKAVTWAETQPSGRMGFSSAEKGAAEVYLPIEDQLSLAVADATVAKVLLAASEAVGEQAAPVGPDNLRRTIQSANADLALLQPAAVGAQGFSSAHAQHFSSSDLPAAKLTFQHQAKGALDKVVDLSDTAVSKLFGDLAKKKEKILEALTKAGELFDGTSDTAVLLRGAWEKLLSALQKIRAIANSVPFQQVEQYLKKLAGAIKIRGVLKVIFQYEGLSDQIKVLEIDSNRRVGEVDSASSSLVEIEARFAKAVSNIRTVTAIATPILSLSVIHFTGPFASLAVPACYALSIVAIVVLGLDFTHAGLSNAGDGIGRIVEELQRPPR